MRRARLPRYGRTPTGLNEHRVRMARLGGYPDPYLARIWRVAEQTIRAARTGKTWKDHPTPPDTAPRGKRGNWGDLHG